MIGRRRKSFLSLGPEHEPLRSQLDRPAIPRLERKIQPHSGVIDRIILKDPAPVLTVQANETGLMQGRESTRAGYFARADVSDLD